jgi:hypothetical protein
MTGSAKQFIARAVIASAAKQSMPPRKERMDCFVAPLLAMTALQLQSCVRGPAACVDEKNQMHRRVVIASAAKQSIAPQ